MCGGETPPTRMRSGLLFSALALAALLPVYAAPHVNARPQAAIGI